MNKDSCTRFCGHMLPFLLCRYQGVELLSQRIGICLDLSEAASSFLQVTVSFYTPTSNV